MRNTLTMSATKISAFLHSFESYGFSREAVLKAASLEPGLLDSPDNRLSSEEVFRIVYEAARLTGNEAIGLHQGNSMPKGFSNILGYLMMNCRSLGEAAAKYCKYEKIVDETSFTTLEVKDDTAVLSTTTIDKVLDKNRQLSDFRVSGMLSYTRLLAGNSINLKATYFEHAKPEDISVYEQTFKCPVYFGKDTNAIVFDKSYLKHPIIEPNEQLLSLFEKTAMETLATASNKETYAKRVINIILREMNGEIPAIDLVAKRLAVSVRSLQGYLRKEGTSYLKLVDEVRKGIAVNYLKEKNVSIAEIAYTLGFSETSSFNRAFKRWTDSTPCEFVAECAL